MQGDIVDHSSQQRRIGVVLSYILLALNMLVGIIVTPAIVGRLGDREYGLYQTIASFANNLAILDFGIGTTVVRFLSKYKASNDNDNQNAVLYSVAKLTCVLSGIVLALGSVLYFLIPPLYSKTLSGEEIRRAQLVFAILVVNVVLTLFDHYCVGICTSSERFQFINTNKILKVLLRVAFIFSALKLYPNAVFLSGADLLITVLFLIIDILYVIFKLKVKVIRIRASSVLFKEIIAFGSTIFLQAFVNQANSNVDKVLLGVLSSAEVVAVYSVAMQIFIIYNSLSSVISSVYLPYVTRRIHSGADPNEIDEIIIRPGRKQFMITGLVLIGFFSIGKDFIRLWMGENYLDAWIIAMIIMVPSMIELVENVAISVTLAKGKNGIRTVIIAGAAVFNILCTILFIKLFGPMGAPLATALSYLFGYIIGVNVFYKKVIGINVVKVYRNIFRGTWICLLLAGAAAIPLKFILTSNYAILLCKALYICLIFAIAMLIIGFNSEEKKDISRLFQRLKRK